MVAVSFSELKQNQKVMMLTKRRLEH